MKRNKKVSIHNLKVEHTDVIRNYDFAGLEQKCQLWNDYINGMRWCYHNEIFGIACNMWRVEGAQRKMIRAIEDNDYYKDKYNKINTIKSCIAYGYMPSRCANFCPYYEGCSNKGLNILHSIDNTRGSIRMVGETSTIKLNEAEEMLKQVFL